MNADMTRLMVMLAVGPWTGPWYVIPITRITIKDRVTRIDYIVAARPCQCDACRQSARGPTGMD